MSTLTWLGGCFCLLLVITSYVASTDTDTHRRRRAPGLLESLTPTHPGTVTSQRTERSVRDLPDLGLNDLELSGAATKRGWCRHGMSFNPVVGMCTWDYSSARGKRAWCYRGRVWNPVLQACTYSSDEIRNHIRGK